MTKQGGTGGICIGGSRGNFQSLDLLSPDVTGFSKTFPGRSLRFPSLVVFRSSGKTHTEKETSWKHDLVIFLCMNRKLELAVRAAVTHTSVISRLRLFKNTLCLFYSRSPRNCRLFESALAILGTEVKRIGKILNIIYGCYRHFEMLTLLLPHCQRLLSTFNKLADTSHSQLKRERERERERVRLPVNKLKSFSRSCII